MVDSTTTANKQELVKTNPLLDTRYATTNLSSSPPTTIVPSPPHQNSPTPSAIIDSGSSHHFLTSTAPCSDQLPTPQSKTIPVFLPNGSIISTSHTAQIPITAPTLPPLATTAHILPNLSPYSLLSVGQFCDAGCTAIFTANNVDIRRNNISILQGARNATTGLWHTPLPVPTPTTTNDIPPSITTTAHCNHLFNPTSTIATRIAWYHATMFAPVLSTWTKAIDAGRFITFPGELTSSLVRKHPPSLLATTKGHLDQLRTNLRSTRIPPPPGFEALDDNIPHQDDDQDDNLNNDDDLHPPPITDPTGYISAASYQVTGQISSDATGRFLTPSTSGHSYILIVYDHDSNLIMAEPMKTRSAADHVAAYQRAHATLTARGFRPKLQRLDNEASTALKQFLNTENITYQLVPPHLHRRNPAERAIRTFKNHFISGLCCTDPDFPLNLWDKLLPQALLTLNLMRQSRTHPQLSAQEHVFGVFNFNTTPIAPPGCKVLVHIKPSTRETWAPHAVDGWYLGPAMESYRCFRVWVNETRSERITETLSWFPHKLLLPTASSTDTAIAAAQDLVTALQHPSPASALSPNSDSQLQALKQLATIFNDMSQHDNTKQPPPPHAQLNPNPIPKKVQWLPTVSVNNPTNTIVPLKDPAPEPRVDPTTPNPPIATYTNRTQNPGQRRRQQRKQAKAASSTKHKPPQQPTELPVRTIANSPGALDQYTTKISDYPTIGPFERSLRQSRYRSLTTWHACSLTTQQLLTTPLVPPLAPTTPSLYAASVIDPDSGALLEYRHLIKGNEADLWEAAWCNEYHRLGPNGTATMKPIHHHQFPTGRCIGYLRIVAALKPLKAEKQRIRFTIAHRQHDYPGVISTPTVEMTTVKCHLNSVISTPGAKYMTLDISDFYLNTPMERPEYIRIPISIIPADIITKYNLQQYVHNGYIIYEVNKGLYGLVQAGKLANEQLQTRLAAAGFHTTANTTGLYYHTTRPITFTLCVDDFGVQYINKSDAQYLLDTLTAHYKITTDWTGKQYLGLTLDWDYTNHTVDISMPGYIERALLRFNHPPPTQPEDSPHSWQAPDYGTKVQLTPEPDSSPPLSQQSITHLQQVIGTLLYYARAVDNTLLVALSELSSQQSKGTTSTMEATTRLLNYCATHPDAIVRFHRSNMCLHVHSDASYLSVSQARSRLGGFFFLGNTPAANPEQQTITINGPILINSTILQHVMSSAAEAELGALFYNAKDAAMLRTTLEDLGFSQPPTPIQTDNACAAGIVNDTVRQRRSKATDMRFYWLRDRVKQKQFSIFWRKGSDNDADYFTKHHPTSHHRLLRSRFLHSANRATTSRRGCVDLRPPPAPGEPQTLIPERDRLLSINAINPVNPRPTDILQSLIPALYNYITNSS